MTSFHQRVCFSSPKKLGLSPCDSCFILYVWEGSSGLLAELPWERFAQ